ncbi:sugar phosphate isomerase/epimerase family protein [Planctomicrobium sp. SH668]|uniref:sugar phosphate isomerase/epimerase family protein n=1 Tax=Planctomicrobium sp. SH668 TaxID=3448126 RepID=UPI003F5B986A
MTFLTRREAIASAAVAIIGSNMGMAAESEPQAAAEKSPIKRRQRFAISTYSFWQFKNDELRDVEKCIDLAGEMGFDGVEILHRQMEQEDNATLQRLKKRAFINGLDLCGFSTHQGFVSPDPEERQKNIDHTNHCIELAYALGIPTLRVNTGRWGTSKDFDTLMANRGIEPIREGCTEEEGFSWVIDSLGECLKVAERCGVTLGLENHWGLGRTASGVMRVVNAIDSPWLRVTMDTGNFLEDMYPQLEVLAPHAVLVQAKTYYGDGLWYTLDIDYNRVASILQHVNYNGYVSLEFEGKAPPLEAIPQSLQMLTDAFSSRS